MSKLENLYKQIDELISKNVTASSPEFMTWKDKVELQLVKFGEGSIQYSRWKKINFSPVAYYNDETDYFRPCKTGLLKAKSLLEAIIDDMEEEKMNASNFDMTKIFIVHGHDTTFKLQIKELLSKVGIEGIILHEQPNTGKTIIEKIEHFGKNVGAAIVLYTPDDIGKANEEPDYKKRARQNVVFESGFFMGYLGRDRVVHVITDSSMEIPGDLSGVVYVDKGDWKLDLAKELKSLKFDIDANKLL